jgi:hypothetical protein
MKMIRMHQLRRLHDKLLLVRASSECGELTIYIKGFLARGEHVDHFDVWQQAHSKLTRTHGWHRNMAGWQWQNGAILEIASVPVPLATLANVSAHLWSNWRRFRLAFPSPATLAMVAGQEAVTMAGQMLLQFYAARQNSHERAHLLSDELAALRGRFTRLRVVAHSLGCKLLVEAIRDLPDELRPCEVHLCAPAIAVESHAARRLDRLAQRHTYLYYCPQDFVLGTVFETLDAGSPCLGATGPLDNQSYERLTAVDVSQHFGTLVHNQYRHRFHLMPPRYRLAE